MKMTHYATIALCALGFTTMIGQAGDDSGKLVLNDEAPSLVKITFDARLRYEYGDLQNLEDSNAATWRNRVGLLTKEINGFQAFVEYEGTLVADRSDYFAPGTELPTGQTPIADPESHELNQAWLAYNAPSDIWGLKVGRQGINLDGQRWIGTVGWRQNMQTYDAAGITFNPTDDLSIYYGFIWQVNRIFGSEAFVPGFTDFKGDSHIINAKYTGLPFGTLTGYVYSLDLHNLAGDVNSNDSVGFSLAGDFYADSTYYLEYAYQTDGSDSPIDYGANYVHANVAKQLGKFKTTIGYEYLGADNGRGFAFPLATLHKFNGFADQFLATPAGGLTDAYISVATEILGCKFSTGYHYFWDDGMDVALGQEIDVVVAKAITENVTILAKAAFYDGMAAPAAGPPGFPAQDVTRFILEANIKY
ncbi:MAG: alginate export family protein [Verrucomicrobiota bacterium]